MKPTIILEGIAKELFEGAVEAIERHGDDEGVRIMYADMELLTAWCLEMAVYFSCMQKVQSEGMKTSQAIKNGSQSMEAQSAEYKSARLAIAEARKILGCMSGNLKNVIIETIGEDVY